MRSPHHSLFPWNPLTAAALLIPLLSSCADTDEDASGNDTAHGQDAKRSTAPATEPASGEPSAPHRLPDIDPAAELQFGDSPLGQMNRHVFSLINGSDPTLAQDWENLLDAAFTLQVSPSELAEVVNQEIQPGAPWELEEFTPVSPQASVSIISSSTGRLSMELSIDPGSELITGVLFAPRPSTLDPVGSFTDLSAALDELPPEIAMLVLEDGAVLFDRGAERVMPLSSTAKLYVLLGLVHTIDRGDTDWDQMLTVTDELRSLPSGQLQEEPSGHQVSVREAAQLMISSSDNTATDMLLHHVGRDVVEEAVRSTGHHDPELMRPYLSTGDFFQLRWGDPELAKQYLSAAETERRDILHSLEDTVLDLDPSHVTAENDAGPELEWFGSAADVAAVHQQLARARSNHPELRQILTANPGLVSAAQGWWDDVAYKGGSALDALSGSWTLTDENGRERTVVVLVRGEDSADVQALLEPVFGLAQDAFAIE